MSTKQTWKAIVTVLAVFFGGLLAIFASFAIGGFPFPSEPVPALVWVELFFLVILIGIPLFR